MPERGARRPARAAAADALARAQPADLGWELGVDLGYLRELCEHWAGELRLARRGADPERARELRAGTGIHFICDAPARAGRGCRILLIHGWPGGVIEFEADPAAWRAAGHDVIVPSLPGYGFSDEPDPAAQRRRRRRRASGA